DSPLSGGQHRCPSRLSHGEGALRVLAKVQLLERHRLAIVLVQQLAYPRRDIRQAPLGGEIGGCLDHATVECRKPAALACDYSVAGVGQPWVDAEHDHCLKDSARRPGRLPVVGCRAMPEQPIETPLAEWFEREGLLDGLEGPAR